MASNKFKISNLSNLSSVSLCSDYILVENSGVSKKTTLKQITTNTTFDEIKTKSIVVNGIALKGFSFRGLGRYINETTIYDTQRSTNVSAAGNAGYIYYDDLTTEGKTTWYASTGTKWYDCGLKIEEASKSNYGVVKIGNGINVTNGVISVTGGGGGGGTSTSFVWWDHYSPPPGSIYTIIFNTEIGITTETTRDVANNTRIGALPVISNYNKDDYTFCGWYDLDDTTKEITEDYIVTKDMNLSAIFVTNIIVLDMNHYEEFTGGTITYNPTNSTVKITSPK